MGTILASAIMASARVTLRDPLPGVYFTDVDLLRFLNEGERNACLLRPDLFTTRGAMPMVAGTLQAIPAGGTALFRLDQNVVGGRRVRLVDSAMLDAALAAWPNATPTVVVEEYCTDARDRRRFHVNPPNTGTGAVVGLYGLVPTPLATSAAAINLDDVWELLLKHFVLCEAYGFATPRQDLNKAGFYRKSFDQMLGINAKTTAEVLPKYGATPGAA